MSQSLGSMVHALLAAYLGDVSRSSEIDMERVIAIVDDDESAREGLTRLMSSLGYEAMPYSSADEFVKSAERGRTVCLIADVNMPGLTGPQLHQQLIKAGEWIPTIFVTAYPDEAARKRALQAGVQCYLTKPIREDELLACVRSVLKNAA